MFDKSLPQLFHRKIHHDNRGLFSELFSSESLNELGFNQNLQINFSKSKLGVIRGFHFQNSPYAQAKLVACTAGKVIDAIFDTNSNSANISIQYFELTAEWGEVLYIPEGYAHAFQALENECEIIYAVSKNYSPSHEVVLNVLDSDLGAKWPEQPILSARDTLGISLQEWHRINRGALN